MGKSIEEQWHGRLVYHTTSWEAMQRLRSHKACSCLLPLREATMEHAGVSGVQLQLG